MAATGRTFDLAEIDRLLTTTRTVRKRLDLERLVDPQLITECLRLATHAPSAANTQLWRWVVLTDPEKRAQVGEIYRGLFHARVSKGAQAPPGSEANRVYLSARHLADNLGRVPVHVIPCYLQRPDPEARNIMLTSLYGSILQAVWSFQLALRSRGLASAWTTMHLAEETKIGALLGIPEDVTQVALIPVAHLIGQDFRPPPRLPVEDVTFWNEWGATA
jgi:nitroreductase